MALLPISGGRVSVAAGPVAPSDTYKDGLRYAGDAVRGAAALTAVTFSQGLPMDENGMLCLVDATSGIPANASVQNGLTLASASLCTSTNAIATHCNGIPLDINGAVCV